MSSHDDPSQQDPPGDDGREVKRPASVLGARLARLMTTVSNPRRPGKPWNPADLQAEMSEKGFPVSDQAVRNLLSKPDPNPKLSTLDGLAAVFDVPVDFFADSNRGQQIADQVELALTVKKLGDGQMLTRLTSLSSADAQIVDDLLKRLHSAEHRDDNDG